MTAAPYTLYLSPDSASTILRLVLEELGLPYHPHPIDRAAGELDSPAYRAMQPLGKIPVLDMPEGPMFETAAILLFLSEKHGALAPQPGDADRPAFLSWLFFTAFNLHPVILDTFYTARVAGPDHTDAVLAHAVPRLHLCLNALNQMVERDAPGFLSIAPSVLGYYIAMLMRWLGDMAPDHPAHVDLHTYPALHAICAALETRPAARAVALAENLGPTPFTQPAG
jgi:glutathione S-transferase